MTDKELEPAQFDVESARRIGKATQYVERMYRSSPPPPSAPRGGNHGFWAVICDPDSPLYTSATPFSDDEGRYSWVALSYKEAEDGDDVSDLLVPDKTWGYGYYDGRDYTDSNSYVSTQCYAIEAQYRSKWVLRQSVVWMWPSGQDYFLFDYRPGVIVAELTETITAMSSNVPGYGKARYSPYSPDFHQGGNYLYYSVNNQEIDVYNSFATALDYDPDGSAWYLQLTFGSGGLWWLTGADCQGA